MQTNSLDILEKSQLPPSQARAILKAMENEIAAREEVLATKSELKEAFHALQLEIQGLRGDMRTEAQTLRGELRTEIAALRAENKSDQGKMSRWVLTCTMGQTALIAGAVYFALKHLG